MLYTGCRSEGSASPLDVNPDVPSLVRPVVQSVPDSEHRGRACQTVASGVTEGGKVVVAGGATEGGGVVKASGVTEEDDEGAAAASNQETTTTHQPDMITGALLQERIC